MVVTAAEPTAEMGVIQDRVGTPFRCTVQAPQKLLPQPNLVPFKSSTSRSTQSKGICGSAERLCALPLTWIVNCTLPPKLYGQSARGSKAKSRFILA